MKRFMTCSWGASLKSQARTSAAAGIFFWELAFQKNWYLNTASVFQTSETPIFSDFSINTYINQWLRFFVASSPRDHQVLQVKIRDYNDVSHLYFPKLPTKFQRQFTSAIGFSLSDTCKCSGARCANFIVIARLLWLSTDYTLRMLPWSSMKWPAQVWRNTCVSCPAGSSIPIRPTTSWNANEEALNTVKQHRPPSR